MTNEVLIAKIKAEVERLKSIEYPCDNSQQATGFFNALDRMTDFLDTLESGKPMDMDDAMKELDEKIAIVKRSGTWDGVDVDKYMDEVRGRESEKPVQKGLEEAAKEYAEGIIQREDALMCKQAFIAGAKWQKEQDEILKVNYEGARTVYDNTVQHLQEKIDEKYELGKKDMKEQMLKEAVEGVLVDNVDGTQEICLHGNRYGEKVRIIIVKED